MKLSAHHLAGNMKFSIVQYNIREAFQEKKIPIGVIIQSDEGIFYKFDNSNEKFELIKSNFSGADKETFENFQKTFEENFINVDKISISDENGNQILISKNDPQFLEYLNGTYQSTYTYSKPTPLEGSEPKTYLDLIFEQQVKHAFAGG